MRQIEDDEEEAAKLAAGATVKKKRNDQFYKLVEACKRKDLALIQQILGEHPQLLNYQDKHHRNLLHYTAILVLGGPASCGDDQSRGRSQAADNREQTARCLECFRFLLGKCEPKLWVQCDQDGLTVLHLAVISCNVPLVREILFEGPPRRQVRRTQALGQSADLSSLISALDKEHHSPLHWAVITNNLECVKLLVAHSGVQLAHQPDLNGATPLHYATQTSDYPKYRQQLRQMLKNATNSTRSSTSCSPSSPATSTTASGRGSSSCASSPLSSCDFSNANHGADGVAFVGNNKKQQQQSETTISHDVEQQEEEEEDEAQSKKKRKKLARVPSSCDENNNKSLEIAQSSLNSGSSASNNLDILKFLAQLEGVNLECRDKDSRTPLLWAASSGNRQAILLLLRCGANPLCQDANKLGPLHCSASHGFTDCLESFLSWATSSRSQALTLHEQVNQADYLSCTPLFYAVLSGNIDCVELLLERGARHDWQDVKGRSAAHFAALKGQLSTLKLLDARGANLWLANKQGDLPLHYAIKSGRQQVVAWLLEHSPYERAVNAINNTGRAPIHLAILKNNPTLIDFLISQGANLNQLVKVKDKARVVAPAVAAAAAATSQRDSRKMTSTVSTSVEATLPNETYTKSSSSSYHYETALDMARRLNQRECLELLTQHSAQPASWVLAQRQQSTTISESEASKSMGLPAAAGNAARSLFDLRAAEVASSPIGFETSGSSAEPPQLEDQTLAGTRRSATSRLPKLPGRPEPLESMAPQSESSNSSALSQSSLTSIRGVRQPTAPPPPRPQEASARHDYQRARTDRSHPAASSSEAHNQKQQRQRQEQQERTAGSSTGRPYRGGINYHNERINASIKCKLYENQSGPGHKSFPPANESQRARQQRERANAQYHSAGQVNSAAGGAGQQEIITNVNVYTTSPRCVRCLSCDDDDALITERCGECRRHAHAQQETGAKSGSNRRASLGSNRVSQHVELSEISDTSDASSEIIYDDGSDRSEINENTRVYLPPLVPEVDMIQTHGQLQRGEQQRPQQQQQQQVRYLPPSQGYTQHLPVILSAEEERSTSGDTINDQQQVSPDSQTAQAIDKKQQPQQQQQMMMMGHSRGATSPASAEPRFDRSHESRGPTRRVDRYREQVRSPVAEYIRCGLPSDGDDHRAVSLGRVSDVRGWSHQQHQQHPLNARMDYSQVRAKVDSHRNDSGLSSHFGDDLDGTSSVGRRSKSWSTLPNQQQQQQLHHGQMAGHEQGPGGDLSPLAFNRVHEAADPHSRSSSRQTTIIKTRRLSVDSVELASSVEKSIRKYKQENKLFEELQNLKRSQIRSGRANEALLVKRLVERFRSEVQRDTPMSLDTYHGPYTYQAYELYLYDQLRKLSQSNCAKLEGARVPHKFTYHDDLPGEVADHHHHQQQQQQQQQYKQPLDGKGHTAANYETRDFLEEDLKAEQELQRVLNESEAVAHETRLVNLPVAQGADVEGEPTAEVLIEPSGALEDIRVRRKESQVVAAADSEQELVPDGDKEEFGTDDAGPQLASKLEKSDLANEDADKQSALETRETERKVSDGASKMQLEDTLEGSRGSQTDSAASSRRTSVDVELASLQAGKRQSQQQTTDDDEDRLLSSLASEKERQRIETQALDLTEAIISDALGNVSRAGSAIGQQRKRASESESQSEMRESVDRTESADDSLAGDSSTKTAPLRPEVTDTTGAVAADDEPEREDEEQQRQQQQQQSEHVRGRRRSVVNIGNKVEVIYHDVGIEIDTVGENQASDDEETRPVEGSAAASQRGGDEASKQTKLEKVYEHEDEAEMRQDEETEDTGVAARAAQREQQNEQEAGGEMKKITDQSFAESDLEEGEEDDKVDEQVDPEEEPDSMSHTPSSSIVPLEREELAEFARPADKFKMSAPSSTFLRRASSPTAPQKPDSRPTHRGAGDGRQVASRRSSIDSHYPSTSDMIVVQRKVFNGFDLDSLHAHRRRQQSITNQETREAASDSKQRQRISAKKRKFEMRRPRSRPPAGPYLIYVPTELIHKRWLEVKRHERQRKRSLELGLESHRAASHTADVEFAAPRRQLVVGQDEGGAGVFHAKSQPNLADRSNQESVLGETDAHLKQDVDTKLEATQVNFSNFVLIYELNKCPSYGRLELEGGERRVTQEREQRHAGVARVEWCRRRITRIVDVRTLKRTLSLPECLIYSNDLLKRFNILKL